MEAETKQREEMEARMEGMIQQRVAAERQNMEEDQRRMIQRIEEENRLRMDQMFQYMKNFALSMGQALPPPPVLFPPPQPPTTTPVCHLIPYTADWMFVVVGLNVSFDACTCDMFRALVKSSLAPAICLLAKITGLGRHFDLHGHALLYSHSSY